MTVLDLPMHQAMHAVDVLCLVRERLEAQGALDELYIFHRMSSDELAILVERECRA